MFRPAVLTRRDPVPGKNLVCLELSAQVLVRLLSRGYLHAAEFRCLDLKSQQQVTRLLLESCVESLQRGLR